MFNLTDNLTWESTIQALSTTDQLEGGPLGVMTIPMQQLANRTAWLKEQLHRQPLVDVMVLNANTTLSAGDVGKGVVFEGLSPSVPTPIATLPPLASVAEGRGYFFITTDSSAVRMGKVQTSSAEIIQVNERQVSSLSVKPGTAGFYIIKNGSKWRLLGESPYANVGAVTAFAMNAPLRGWIVANGMAYSRSVFSELFAVIGTTFGAGDGSTTFNVPDLRGEFIRGFDSVGAVDPSRTFGSNQADEIKSHRHGLNTVSVAAGTTAVAAIGETNVSPNNVTKYTGGTETRPRNVALLYCIKY